MIHHQCLHHFLQHDLVWFSGDLHDDLRRFQNSYVPSYERFASIFVHLDAVLWELKNISRFLILSIFENCKNWDFWYEVITFPVEFSFTLENQFKDFQNFQKKPSGPARKYSSEFKITLERKKKIFSIKFSKLGLREKVAPGQNKPLFKVSLPSMGLLWVTFNVIPGACTTACRRFNDELQSVEKLSLSKFFARLRTSSTSCKTGAPSS